MSTQSINTKNFNMSSAKSESRLVAFIADWKQYVALTVEFRTKRANW